MLCYCYCNLLNAQNHHHWPPCKGTAIQVDIFGGHPKYPSRKLCIHFIQYVTSPLKALNISSIPPFWLNELKINMPFKMFYNTKLMLSSISTCFWAVNYDSFILKLMFFHITRCFFTYLEPCWSCENSTTWFVRSFSWRLGILLFLKSSSKRLLPVTSLDKLALQNINKWVKFHLVKWVSDCCLMPTQQFFSYIMARKS